MSVGAAKDRSVALAPAEWLFLALVIVGWAVFVISLGKRPLFRADFLVDD